MELTKVSMIIRRIFSVAILVLLASCNKESATEADMLSGIQAILPEGWHHTVIDEAAKMGHPAGLEEPIFRIDFLNSKTKFSYTHRYFSKPDKTETYNPCLRLHFHPITDKEPIMKTIARLSHHSFAIPLYFDETKEYIVITSPGWINHGLYNEQATALYTPLEKALKNHFKKFK